MMQEINPAETSRAYAFEMWMKAPMPMVTFFKTLDVSRLLKFSKSHGMKFNMLMCWCIGKAASQIKEFYMLPIGDKLFRYDTIAVNTIVANSKGEVSSCDIPFSNDLSVFNAEYLRLTRKVAESCKNHDITDSMVISNHIIPIPSYPDGRCSCSPISRLAPDSDTEYINYANNYRCLNGMRSTTPWRARRRFCQSGRYPCLRFQDGNNATGKHHLPPAHVLDAPLPNRQE